MQHVFIDIVIYI